jgi:adenine deaminase
LKNLKKKIRAAKGEAPADLILKGGKVVNVFSGEILDNDVALLDGVIVGVGTYENGEKTVNVEGKWILPGFIDGHFHIESSMMRPQELAASLLVHGTTTLVSDPHEIANVMGLEGVRYMMKESSNIPFDIFYLAPSCVPATHLETSGGALKASELQILKDDKSVLGLAEVMNFPGVLECDDELLKKIIVYTGDIIDGHCPGLGGNNLQGYIAAGMRSDHEISEISEASEKLRSGMMIMIREGSSAKNLEDILPLVNEKNERRFCIVSDDLHAEDIKKRGHLDGTLKKAVGMGLDRITAIRMVTLNPSEYFGLKDRGAVAAGLKADLLLLDDIDEFKVNSVYKNGRQVVRNGSLVDFDADKNGNSKPGKRRVLNIADLKPEHFAIQKRGDIARIIGIIPGQIITSEIREEIKSRNGYVIQDTESDILKICVVERHKATGNIGIGLVKGFGLKEGALASSVAHDSHNVIGVGANDYDLCRAIEAVRDMGGGLAVVNKGEILAENPLQIGGLMSTLPLESLLSHLREVKHAAGDLGCTITEPFMALSFLALPVIPHLKLTDLGLIDVKRFSIVDLFVDI